MREKGTVNMDYLETNKKGRERLRGLANRLTDQQLALPAGDGWTIAALLAHLAFSGLSSAGFGEALEADKS